jgi:hypothetical protein
MDLSRLTPVALAPVAVASAVAALSLAFLVSSPETRPVVAVAPTPAPTPTATPEPKPLSKAEFITQADAICGKIAKIEMDGDDAGLEDSANDVAKFRKHRVKSIDKLLALVPPR